MYLARLESEGHEVRRSVADYLRDGIHELRPSFSGVHYRILYFFYDNDVVVVSHGRPKENSVVAAKKKFESAALQYTFDRFVAGDPKKEDFYEQAFFDTEVASMIYDLRTKSGLSQRALAKKVGTTASVICRLEDADYEGHSLAMLRRIAAALGKCIEIRFVPLTKPKRPRTRKAA